MMRSVAVDHIVEEGILKRANLFIKPAQVRDFFRDKVSDFLRSKPNKLQKVELELKKIEQETDRILDAYTRFERPIPESRIKELNARRGKLEGQRKSLIDAGECHFFDADREANAFLKNMKSVESVLEKGEFDDRLALRNNFLKRADVNWLAPSGEAEVELEWFRVPKFVDIGGEFEHKGNPSTSTFLFIKN